jgi:hypothetical protein
MSTNAVIAHEIDGKFKCIYLHWDGYPEEAGIKLNMFYNTPEKVQELLDMGDCSILKETIKESEFFHRDRGEFIGDVCAEFFDSFGEIHELYETAQWIYVFNENGWGHTKTRF